MSRAVRVRALQAEIALLDRLADKDEDPDTGVTYVSPVGSRKSTLRRTTYGEVGQIRQTLQAELDKLTRPRGPQFYYNPCGQ